MLFLTLRLVISLLPHPAYFPCLLCPFHSATLFPTLRRIYPEETPASLVLAVLESPGTSRVPSHVKISIRRLRFLLRLPSLHRRHAPAMDCWSAESVSYHLCLPRPSPTRIRKVLSVDGASLLPHPTPGRLALLPTAQCANHPIAAFLAFCNTPHSLRPPGL